MTVKAMENGGMVITGDHIKLYQMHAQLAALKLEVLGMTRHGRSAYSIIKQAYGLRGTKARVAEQFKTLIEKTAQQAS